MKNKKITSAKNKSKKIYRFQACITVAVFIIAISVILSVLYMGSQNETFMPIAWCITGICFIIHGLFGVYKTKAKWYGLNGEIYGKHPHTDENEARLVSFVGDAIWLIIGFIILIFAIIKLN